ncbi:MAG: lamin tail domain-containing protein, partial [Anaerohalosphaera sp.]|nr:lamin tail domain-containing protein [Anaerohalosphaera sp.]
MKIKCAFFVSILLVFCCFLSILSAQCPEGDLSGNGVVGVEDLLIFAEQWLEPAGCAGHPEDCADLTGNDGVNSGDFAVIAANWDKQCQDVRINEIHYDADVRIELVEFVELYNAGANDLDISGWSFTDGIDYTFDASTVIPSGGYIVVAQNTSQVVSKYGVPSNKVHGPFVGKLSNEGEEIELSDSDGNVIERVDYGMGFPWPTVGYVASELDEGDGNSIQLINTELDNDLGGSWRSGFPTPCSQNSGLWTNNAPPQIRQVNHSPKQPASGEPIVFTAKVTDPDGVDSVTLSYQIVVPGSYIPAFLPLSHSVLINNPDTPFSPNPAFENPANWTTITMTDNGTGNDEFADDGIFTATLSTILMNRTIVRYRITVEDNNGNSLRVPYDDDPSLNFAAYIYDGVPDYVAQTRSVSPDGAGHVYSNEIMTSLPVYSLIARADDIVECIAYDSADRISSGNRAARSKFNWEGTFVYDGKVYDHVPYRLRGFNQRYSGGGKRAWRVRFMRGNYLQARDNFGKKYPNKWRTLNISKGCDHLLGHGNFGLNEMINADLFNMVGIPSPYMNAFHFRVVDAQEEAPTGTNGQYYGDFWGMFFGVEDYDARFIEAHDLPEGNLYKLKCYTFNGNDIKRFQGVNSVTDDSDFQNIRHNCDPYQSNEWLASHVNLDHWYRYNTICEMIIHRDYNPSDSHLKNRAWFFEEQPGSQYGKLKLLPHDTDSSWLGGFTWDGNGDYPEETIYADHPGHSTPGYGFYYTGTWPPKEDLKLQHRNVMREFRDLLWTEEQIFPLLDNLAAIIQDMASADRDRWKNAPADAGYQDWGSMESRLAEMKSFAFGNGAREDFIDDTFVNAEGDLTAVPDKPVISYTGPAGYPANSLTFESSDFSDPQGNGTFAAMKWRIARIDPTEEPPVEEPEVELLEAGDDNWKYFKGTEEPSAPGEWRLAGFNENNDWLDAQTSIGYDTNNKYNNATILNDMRGNYWSIYLRNTFEVANPATVEALRLDVYVDDGCIIWINGTEVARPHVSDGDKAFDDKAINHEASWEIITLSNIGGLLVAGENTIAVHVLNQSITSSDLSINIGITSTNAPMPIQKPTRQRKCEIVADWQSEDITTFSDTIQVPASAVKPDRLY